MPVALSGFFCWPGQGAGGEGREQPWICCGETSSKPIFRYLGAAFSSAMLAAVYSLVDMAMVGQYQGPDGAAALAVVAPVWNILYSLGMLTGMGGSVLYSATGRRAGFRRPTGSLPWPWGPRWSSPAWCGSAWWCGRSP